MEPKKTTDENGVLIPQGNYFKIKTTETIPFCDGTLEVGCGLATFGEFRIMLAQLEIMGVEYLNALKKHGVTFNEGLEKDIRRILTE